MPLKNLVQNRVVSLANMFCHEVMEDNDTTLSTVMDSLEREIVAGVYTMCHNNKVETAKRLGISRAGLYFKLGKYGLIPPGEQQTNYNEDGV